MARKTYIVKEGDNLANVSRFFYGVPNRTEDIIRENADLQHRRDVGATYLDGTPFLEGGDVLSVTVDPAFDLTTSNTAAAGDENTPVLHINGIREPMPHGTSLTLYYDACANTMQSKFPWDPMDDLDKSRWGSPSSLPDVDVYFGPKMLFGGRFESISYGLEANDRSVSVRGRTHTGVLVKSHLPFGVYPLERRNESLNQILSWMCGVWGIDVEGTPGIDTPFKKVSIESTQQVSQVAVDLALQRNSVVQTDSTGRVLRIVTPELKDPMEYLDYGDDSFSIGNKEYDTTLLHDIHQGISETSKNVKDKKNLTIGQLGDHSVMSHDLDNQTEGTSDEHLRFLAFKSFREYLALPIVIPGYLNKSGELYNVGDVIAVRYPPAAIYNFRNYMVRVVKYDFDRANPTVTLTAVPPQVYLAALPA